MSWFDDAKEKAEEASNKAKDAAAERAAKAAVSAAAGAVSSTVNGFFEGIVSSAEAALDDAQKAAGHKGEQAPAFPETDAAADALQQTLDAPPQEDVLGRAMQKAARAPEAVPSTPAPRKVDADPFAAARRALAASREARGVTEVEEEPPPRPADPVQAALAAAAEARAHASTSRRTQAREDAAREQLAALKASMGGSPRPSDDDTEAPKTKKRRL